MWIVVNKRMRQKTRAVMRYKMMILRANCALALSILDYIMNSRVGARMSG